MWKVIFEYKAFSFFGFKDFKHNAKWFLAQDNNGMSAVREELLCVIHQYSSNRWMTQQ